MHSFPKIYKLYRDAQSASDLRWLFLANSVKMWSSWVKLDSLYRLTITVKVSQGEGRPHILRVCHLIHIKQPPATPVKEKGRQAEDHGSPGVFLPTEVVAGVLWHGGRHVLFHSHRCFLAFWGVALACYLQGFRFWSHSRKCLIADDVTLEDAVICLTGIKNLVRGQGHSSARKVRQGWRPEWTKPETSVAHLWSQH